ncbi:MAG: hypothetical protein PPP58_11205 [Natronomonas sp.]
MEDTSHTQDAADASAPKPDVETPRQPALDGDRYAHVSLDGGEIVIYDRESPEAYLQSDSAVQLG